MIRECYGSGLALARMPQVGEGLRGAAAGCSALIEPQSAQDRTRGVSKLPRPMLKPLPQLGATLDATKWTAHPLLLLLLLLLLLPVLPHSGAVEELKKEGAVQLAVELGHKGGADLYACDAEEEVWGKCMSARS